MQKNNNGAAPLINIGKLAGTIHEVKNRQMHLPSFIVFSGPSGYGKSHAAAYNRTEFDCIYIEADASWGVSSLLDTILEELGHPLVKGLISKQLTTVIRALVEKNTPLIIDEFDHCVKPKFLEIIRVIHDKAYIPIVVIGEELLPQKLEETERFHNRVNTWVKAEPVTFININEGTITLKGISQDLALARVKQNRVFEQQSLENILNKIANSLALSVECDSSLSNKQIPYLLQSNKSDLSLLAELGELYYAVANIKNKKLIFMAKDSKQTAITIADGLIQSINKEDSEYKIYNGVKASLWDTKTATKKEISLGSLPYLIVPNIYGEMLSKEQVKSKYKEIKEQEIIELTLLGKPELQAGLTITIPSTSGYEDYKGIYKIKTIKHQFNGEYFTTFITAYKL